jgi:phosphoglycolate phosphatase
MEIVRPFSPRPNVSHVIFDMDGTLSWLRHGWPELMVDLFRAYFPSRPGETEQQIHDLLIAEILSLNGKPSIYQMLRFTEHVRERGGTAPAPEALLDQYQTRLDAVIEERIEKLQGAGARPDEFVVFGARALLEKIERRGLTLIILSGTIEHRVKHEAGLLGFAHYFRNHIYGGTPDHTQFSKAGVVARILREENISGEHLVSFGDGPVEIQCTKEVGALTIGVASDENENGSGIADPHKREQLIKAGAHLLIPDYRDEKLFEMVFGS